MTAVTPGRAAERLVTEFEDIFGDISATERKWLVDGIDRLAAKPADTPQPAPDAMRKDTCPRCGSTAPHMHPAVQHEGEVELCTNEFHLRPTNQNTAKYIAAVEAKRALSAPVAGEHGIRLCPHYSPKTPHCLRAAYAAPPVRGDREAVIEALRLELKIDRPIEARSWISIEGALDRVQSSDIPDTPRYCMAGTKCVYRKDDVCDMPRTNKMNSDALCHRWSNADVMSVLGTIVSRPDGDSPRG